MPLSILITVLRTFAAFFVALTIARFIGRKTIGQMTFFDFVVAVTLGSVTANAAIGLNHQFYSVVTVLISLGIAEIITAFLRLKNLRFSKLVNSEPVTAIENGQIIDKNLKKTRLTLTDLNMMLRSKNIFNIADVEFAILETNGELSVLPKSQKQPLTPSDLHMPTEYKGLDRDMIVDGKIMYENLKAAKLDEKWLLNELQANGINSSGEVFFAALDTSGYLYVSKRRNTHEDEGHYGIE
ncbi:MAG: DUF421 domain-containing protein [Bacillota bacterium]|nr:DUF421 domain-containing protein [Bacillota bacterium]